jgi:hypothetical protein
MATGDQSGTWGNTTNTNLELIAEAFGFGTEAISTNADTHTSTIADGATDPVRAHYVKYTGTLDSACTITIAPNTINRFHIIENATSGSQNIIISQGSGSNVTIAAGTAKAVYLDGAGSGAAVTDAFSHLSVVDLTVDDDLTVTDNLLLASDDSVLSFGADSDVTVTHDPDDGLILKSTATGDDNPFLLTLQTGETDIAADDVLGKIAFQAPDEGTDTDSRLLAAAIQARSEGDFAADSNATSIDFMTGASEAATTKMTLTSAGNVGIGTDSPTSPLGTNFKVLDINSGVWGGNINFSGNSGGYIGNRHSGNGGLGYYAVSGQGHDFAVNGATASVLNIASDGDVTIQDGDLVIGTAGHGIDFSAAAAGQPGTGTDPAETSTATILDDYEEGTFTPVSNSVDNANATKMGMYVKVGNLVNISIRFTPSSDSTNGHQFGFHLPFEAATTESSGSFNTWACPVHFSSAPNGNGLNRIGTLGGDGNYLNVRQQGTTSSSEITGNAMGGTFGMDLSITYRTTS